jgi:hypothetical protein
VGAHSSGTRFDYLFERIAAETTDEFPAVEAVVSAPRARRWWPMPVVAVMAGLAGAVVVIQSWPGAGDDVPGPSAPVTHLAPTPIVSTVPVVEAPAELVAPPEAPPVVEASPAVEPAPVVEASPVVPQPVAPPPPSSNPEPRQAPTPTRSPNSVSPEPRPAFPNQHVPDNDNDGGRGGLLGRLGL